MLSALGPLIFLPDSFGRTMPSGWGKPAADTSRGRSPGISRECPTVLVITAAVRAVSESCRPAHFVFILTEFIPSARQAQLAIREEGQVSGLVLGVQGEGSWASAA